VKTFLISFLFLCTIPLSACSSDEESKSSAPEPKPPAQTASLEFTLIDVEDSTLGGDLRCTMSIPAQCNGELECESAETSPACEHLFAKQDELFQEIPADSACTLIFAGPEKATITGTVNGEDVNIELNRSGGCELARWDLHSPLWGVNPTTA
jgi:hypothetical protein